MANYQLSYTGTQVNDAVKQVVSQEFDNVMTGVSPNSSANDTSLVTAEWVKDYAPSLSNTFLLKPTATLSSGANLNTYTTPGCWICTSATIAANITNTPVTNGGFTLRVMTGTGGSWVVQEVISGYGFRYFRYYTGSTWSSWNVELYTQDIDNVSDLPGKVYEVNFAEKAVPAKTSYTIASLTLPSGTYVISGDSGWGTDSNSTYIVARIVSQSKGELVINRGVMIGGGGLTPIVIFEVESQDTINFVVYWGSGSNSGAVIHNSGAFRALRIR